jgi:hypothetical protein
MGSWPIIPTMWALRSMTSSVNSGLEGALAHIDGSGERRRRRGNFRKGVPTLAERGPKRTGHLARDHPGEGRDKPQLGEFLESLPHPEEGVSAPHRMRAPAQLLGHVSLPAAEGGLEHRGLKQPLRSRCFQAQHDLAECDDSLAHLLLPITEKEVENRCRFIRVPNSIFTLCMENYKSNGH